MTNKITKVYKNWVEYDIYASGWAAWTGDVTWPSSSTDADIALFDWATWKIIKDSWKKLSNYQTALSTQTAYTTKGTATKVPTITTNTLWQVTGITETSITFPVTSVNGSTWAVTGLQTTSNLKTSLSDNSDGYYPSQKAVKTAVDGKQDTLVSWTNIKTVNWNSLLGSWNISLYSTITVTLTSAWWSSNSQTVSATGVTASNTVFVSPAPSSIWDYADGGVYCSLQWSWTLTFECDTEPTNDITVNVVIFN